MRRSLPDIALRVHVDVPQDLINQVASGMVDVAIMYAPQHRPGLKIDLLTEEKLVLVTTSTEARPLDTTEYVYMDWGPDFTLHHGMNFPDVTPGILMDLGPLALSYVLAAGGSGYFRMSAVQPHISAGRLHLVPEMPQFAYPVYAVQSASADESVVGPALTGLHSIANGSAK
jgi:DNA-binding transcriptional LysR family regulator